MNRSQRILRFIADSTAPVSMAAIVAAAAVDEPRIESQARFALSVSAQVSQFVKAKKIARAGVLAAYTYSKTALTLSDLRKVDRVGQARDVTALARATKPAARTTAKPPAAPQPAVRSKAQRLAMANLGPAAPRRPGERESVAEFEARGGRIQKLAHGESSQPAYINVRAVDERGMRARLQKALDTEPANTSADDVVAA